MEKRDIKKERKGSRVGKGKGDCAEPSHRHAIDTGVSNPLRLPGVIIIVFVVTVIEFSSSSVVISSEIRSTLDISRRRPIISVSRRYYRISSRITTIFFSEKKKKKTVKTIYAYDARFVRRVGVAPNASAPVTAARASVEMRPRMKTLGQRGRDVRSRSYAGGGRDRS